MPKFELTEEEKKILQELTDEITLEAKSVVEDYTKNPSDISGSLNIHINEKSPYLDESEITSGNRWKHVIKTEDDKNVDKKE